MDVFDREYELKAILRTSRNELCYHCNVTDEGFFFRLSLNSEYLPIQGFPQKAEWRLWGSSKSRWDGGFVEAETIPDLIQKVVEKERELDTKPDPIDREIAQCEEKLAQLKQKKEQNNEK